MPFRPSDEVYAFPVTIPAGTALASPVVIATPIPPRTVNRINVVVPPGPSGLMGFQIGMVGVQVVPINTGNFVVTDDEKISWELENLPESGAWQVIGYNTDVYDHTIQVRYEVSLIVKPPVPVSPHTAQTLAPIPQAATASKMAII